MLSQIGLLLHRRTTTPAASPLELVQNFTFTPAPAPPFFRSSSSCLSSLLLPDSRVVQRSVSPAHSAAHSFQPFRSTVTGRPRPLPSYGRKPVTAACRRAQPPHHG